MIADREVTKMKEDQ